MRIQHVNTAKGECEAVVRLSRIDRFSLGPIEEGSKRGRDGSRGAGVLARDTRSCT